MSRAFPRFGLFLRYPLSTSVVFLYALPVQFSLWAHVLVLGPLAFAVIWRKPRTPPVPEPSPAEELAREVNAMLAAMPAGIFSDRPDDVCNRSTREIHSIRSVHRAWIAYAEARERERERMESIAP